MREHIQYDISTNLLEKGTRGLPIHPNAYPIIVSLILSHLFTSFHLIFCQLLHRLSIAALLASTNPFMPNLHSPIVLLRLTQKDDGNFFLQASHSREICPSDFQ